jgi:hypothetical protein|tara:strand:+ start:1334 stop:1588 length:255 start_codon:yes stop_codon:yes gene_type:complete
MRTLITEAANVLSGNVTDLTEVQEAVNWWKVTITKKSGKLAKGTTVDVKAKDTSDAIKKGLKQMNVDPMLVRDDSVDAVLAKDV